MSDEKPWVVGRIEGIDVVADPKMPPGEWKMMPKRDLIPLLQPTTAATLAEEVRKLKQTEPAVYGDYDSGSLDGWNDAIEAAARAVEEMAK